MSGVIERLCELKAKTVACDRCPLCHSRRSVVFGDIPDKHPSIVLGGEAPGLDEDLQGRPFVGKTGKLLRGVLELAGIQVPNIFVTNCLMCRPPDNRDPLPSELAACRPWLDEKINIIEPSIIIAVGRFSAAFFLNVDIKQIKITKLSGKRIDCGKYVVVPLVHPSFVARGGKTEKDYLVEIAQGLYGNTTYRSIKEIYE